MNKFMVFLGAFIVITGLSSASLVKAADFVSPDSEQGNINLSSSETFRNLYTAGSDIRIGSATQGDLLVAGGKISLDGKIEQDVTGAGGEITLNGDIGGDVRIAGGSITANSKIAGDAIVFGGDIKITDRATIGGDLIIFSGNVILDAPVTGKVKIYGGTITINNQIAGEVLVEAGDSLTFGPKAVVAGKITYKGPQEAVIQDGAKVSSVEWTKLDEHRGVSKYVGKIITIGFILQLLAYIAAALLILRLMPQTTRKVIENMEMKPWVNLGIGFLGLVVTPIAVFILFLLFIGWYVAMLVIFGYILLLMLAGLAAAVFLGAWVIKMLTKKPSLVVDWQAIVIGVALMAILKFIPVAGWLVAFMLMLIAFGALIRMLKDRIDSEQPIKATIENN